MGIMDSYRKMREEGREHSTPPAKGFTLAEILKDKSSSDLFGKLLKKEGQEELALRVIGGKLEADDIHLLEELRLKFVEKIDQSEKIEKLLTKENIAGIARKHPDFAKVINLLGPEKAIKAIRSQMKGLCITDEDRFNAIAEPVVIYDSYQNGQYKESNDRVEKMCEDMGINQQEYLDALAIKDPDEKEKALKKLAKGKYGKYRAAWNKISGKNREKLGDLKDAELSLENSIDMLDSYKTDIGDALFTTVHEDDMRDAMSRELISETAAPVAEPKIGLGDAKKETAGDFNQKEFNQDWETLKTNESYDALFADEQDALKERFIDQQQKKYREKSEKRKGAWNYFFAALFERNIKSKKDSLK